MVLLCNAYGVNPLKLQKGEIYTLETLLCCYLQPYFLRCCPSVCPDLKLSKYTHNATKLNYCYCVRDNIMNRVLLLFNFLERQKTCRSVFADYPSTTMKNVTSGKGVSDLEGKH